MLGVLVVADMRRGAVGDRVVLEPPACDGVELVALVGVDDEVVVPDHARVLEDQPGRLDLVEHRHGVLDDGRLERAAPERLARDGVGDDGAAGDHDGLALADRGQRGARLDEPASGADEGGDPGLAGAVDGVDVGARDLFVGPEEGAVEIDRDGVDDGHGGG